MSRLTSTDRVVAIAIVVLCVIAIAVAAATLNSAVVVGDGGSGESAYMEPVVPLQPSYTGNSDAGEINGTNDQDSRGMVELGTCITFLTTPLGILSVLAGFIGLLYLIYRQFTMSTAFLSGYALSLPLILGYYLSTSCVGGANAGQDPNTKQSALARAGESIMPGFSIPPWLLGLLFTGALAGALAVLYMSSGDETVTPAAETTEGEPGPDAFAKAAGEAADRIEELNAGVDNSVYRAWIEMTGLLDVDRPEVYTSGEFAEAAIDVGMAEEDVMELTWLFNEVRYGNADPADSEDRAVEILRNIEDRYGKASASNDTAGSEQAPETDDDNKTADSQDGDGEERR